MPITAQSILKRCDELGIIIHLCDDDKLSLRDPKKNLTDKARKVIREHKAAIVAYIKEQEPDSFEDRVIATLGHDCEVTIQPLGYTLAQHIADMREAAKNRVFGRTSKPPWSQHQWKASEEVQINRVEAYHKEWRSNGRPIPETRRDADGYVIVNIPGRK